MGDYKQPRAINSVSITLLLIFAACVWLAYSAWPALHMNSEVKNEIADALPMLWRANLRPEPDSTRACNELKAALAEKLKKIGVGDDKFEIAMTRNKAIVRIEVKHDQVVTLEGTNKSFTIHFKPAVETSAERVEW